MLYFVESHTENVFFPAIYKASFLVLTFFAPGRLLVGRLRVKLTQVSTDWVK